MDECIAREERLAGGEFEVREALLMHEALLLKTKIRAHMVHKLWQQ